jgi:hypothetical protein
MAKGAGHKLVPLWVGVIEVQVLHEWQIKHFVGNEEGHVYQDQEEHTSPSGVVCSS